MDFKHKNLAAGRWEEFSLAEQLGNIGSEVSRARNWKDKDKRSFESAVWRALELFDLTLQDHRWLGRLREINRAREIFCDVAFGNNNYGFTLEDLDRYFLRFALVAREE